MDSYAWLRTAEEECVRGAGFAAIRSELDAKLCAVVARRYAQQVITWKVVSDEPYSRVVT